MPKPQLADYPFGILATKKSYSFLWPPWKATGSLLRTHLLFRGNAFKNGVYAPCLSEHCTKSQSKTNGHDPGSSLQKKKSPQVSESTTDLDSGFHAVDSRFQVLDSCYFFSRTWIPDSNLLVEFWILKLYSGLQSPGFRIQISLILESVFPYMGRKKG